MWKEQFDKQFTHEGWCDVWNTVDKRCNCEVGDYEDFVHSQLEKLIDDIPSTIEDMMTGRILDITNLKQQLRDKWL